MQPELNYLIQLQNKKYKYKARMVFQLDKPSPDKGVNIIYARTFEYDHKKRVYNPLFNSWYQACSAYKGYRQAFSGLNHSRRDVIVVDVDRPYDPVLESSIRQKIYNLTGFYPNVTVINDEINPRRGKEDQHHFQIQIFLDEPFYSYEWVEGEEKRLFLSITQLLNKECWGDVNFKGGMIKNPACYNGLSTIIYSLSPISKERLVNNLSPFLSECYRGDKQRKREKSERAKKSLRDALYYRNIDYTPLESSIREQLWDIYGITAEEIEYYYPEEWGSRNCAALSAATSLAFHCKANPNGKPFNKEAYKLAFILYEIISLRYNGKGSIETEEEINRSVNSSWSWVCNNFDYEKEGKGRGRYSDKNREEAYKSKLINKYYKSIQIQTLKKGGMTRKEIVRRLGISTASTIYREADNESISTMLHNIVDRISYNISIYKESKYRKKEKIKEQVRHLLTIFNIIDNVTFRKFQKFIEEVKRWLQNLPPLLPSCNATEENSSYNYIISNKLKIGRNRLPRADGVRDG